MSATVLVVDDEPAIRRLVATILTRGGLAAIMAGDARTALDEATRAPDMAIVDLGLPDRDGLELVASFAARDLPTLVLSARLDVADKIAALDLGAQDYLTKPFDGDELLARVRAMLRRGGRATGTAITYGGIVMEPAFHRASVEGRALSLTPREYALLAALVEAEGRILTHRALLERIWGPAHVGDHDYLRVAIRAVRRKVEVDPARPRLILNVPGIGYRIAG